MSGTEQNGSSRPGGMVSVESQRVVPGARMALFLLFSINLFNYIDRYILAAVEPEAEKCLLSPDDPKIGQKMGSLSTAFLVTYMLTAPLFGFLAERYSRWLLIAVGVSLWSLASGASGLAHDWRIAVFGYGFAVSAFTAMLMTRCFVGIGEGAYGPVAPALISDFFPVHRRGQVLAWFYVAIPVGSALGYVIGEQFAVFNKDAQSWRWAFYAVVIPGCRVGSAAGQRARGAAPPVASFSDVPHEGSASGICLRVASWTVCLIGFILGLVLLCRSSRLCFLFSGSCFARNSSSAVSRTAS